MTMSSIGAQVKPGSSKGDAEQAGEWTNPELGGRWTVGGWPLLLKAVRPQRLTSRSADCEEVSPGPASHISRWGEASVRREETPGTAASWKPSGKSVWRRRESAAGTNAAHGTEDYHRVWQRGGQQ